MPSYGSYDYHADRGSSVEVGTTHCTIRARNGQVRTAVILERREVEGRVVELLLDRVVHDRFERFADGWEAGGAFVTELVRAPGARPAEDD